MIIRVKVYPNFAEDTGQWVGPFVDPASCLAADPINLIAPRRKKPRVNEHFLTETGQIPLSQGHQDRVLL